MAYRVNSKVFETENEARSFSNDLMRYGGLGGWSETTDPVTHIYHGDGYTEPVKIKILLTSDFYYEYELYETSDPDALKSWIRDMMNGRFSKMDETKHKLLGSQDDMDAEDAQTAADEIIYDGDMYED